MVSTDTLASNAGKRASGRPDDFKRDSSLAQHRAHRHLLHRAGVASHASAIASSAAAAAAAAALSVHWARDAGGGMLIVLPLPMLALGVYPSPFIKLAQSSGIEPQPLTPTLAARR
jgi:hypothetical protein